MEESIYNILPPVEPIIVKPKMYRSQFPGVMAPTSSTFKNKTTSNPGLNNINGEFTVSLLPHNFNNEGALYGKPKLNRYMSQQLHPIPILKQSGLMGNNSLECWSKKGDAQRSLSPQLFAKSKIKLKPIVPAHTEQAVVNLRTSKNFIVSNALESILASNICHYYLFSQEKIEPKEEENFLRKRNFGKVPEYLTNIKNSIQEEYDLAQSLYFEQERDEQLKKYLLPQEEIEQIRVGLKAKWTEVNKKFQLMTHIQNLDTIGLRRRYYKYKFYSFLRKIQYEKELKQLETDLEKLGKNYIFVEAGK